MDEFGSSALARAAEAIAAADALLIAAGAGMGVDSGLPDFRGNQGFWRAYPPYAKLGLAFTSLANPRWFRDDPELAWGFYGHRLQLYRRTRPHDGFAILRRWAECCERGWFVYTSNVDNHFQSAGFDADRVYEVHGSISTLQCLGECGAPLFESGDVTIDIDEATMHASGPLPCCPGCGGLARPNILMFGDWEWDASRTESQYRRLTDWYRQLSGARLVVVESGAGTAIPSVRNASDQLVRQLGATLIRINPREPEVPPGQVGLPYPALETLRGIDALLGSASQGG
jgi:NAD-dependent SIR2 family protein deacetylase